ncbi:MAG: hypothetical protein IPM70_17065 [Proteobacteria bacterium]|nr:hypothetical protein [Pseudomonadota bacterium]MBK9253467.1 hypothetical protein [Pseudomonadota bacterium]MCC6630680.1 hypothetical protein [Gammaproteobacteria bacterium]
MDSSLVNLLISLVSGGVGGNVGGAVSKATSLGPVLNTVLGAVGGLGGGQLANHLGGLASLGQAGNVGSSALVGLLLPLVVGFLKKKMAGSK